MMVRRFAASESDCNAVALRNAIRICWSESLLARMELRCRFFPIVIHFEETASGYGLESAGCDRCASPHSPAAWQEEP